MYLAMHTWMRAEPIEAAIRRIGPLGYEALEISDEPERHDIDAVRGLLSEHGIACVYGSCFGKHFIDNIRLSFTATPIPARTPTAEATTATMAASIRTRRVTCDPVAPIARSKASSLTR